MGSGPAGNRNVDACLDDTPDEIGVGDGSDSRSYKGACFKFGGIDDKKPA